jgi:hypothetical protein
MELRTQGSQKIMDLISQEYGPQAIVKDVETRHVARICWTMAKLEDVNNFVAFFKIVEPNAARLLVREGNPQDLVDITCACGEFGVRSFKFFYEIEELSIWLVENGTPQDVSSSAGVCWEVINRISKVI